MKDRFQVGLTAAMIAASVAGCSERTASLPESPKPTASHVEEDTAAFESEMYLLMKKAVEYDFDGIENTKALGTAQVTFSEFDDGFRVVVVDTSGKSVDIEAVRNQVALVRYIFSPAGTNLGFTDSNTGQPVEQSALKQDLVIYYVDPHATAQPKWIKKRDGNALSSGSMPIPNEQGVLSEHTGLAISLGRFDDAKEYDDQTFWHIDSLLHIAIALDPQTRRTGVSSDALDSFFRVLQIAGKGAPYETYMEFMSDNCLPRATRGTYDQIKSILEDDFLDPIPQPAPAGSTQA